MSGRGAEEAHPRIIKESIDIEAPPEVIFRILVDPGQHSRIDGSGSVQKLLKGPARLSDGATFGMDMKLFGVPYKIRNTVVEFEENSRIAWRHFAGHRWRYVLDPIEDGTRVTESWDYSRLGLTTSLFIPFTGFPERNRGSIAGTLAKLKEAAEADARGGVA